MKIELDEKELNVILAGLGKLPAEVSFTMIIKLQKAWENKPIDNQDVKEVTED